MPQISTYFNRVFWSAMVLSALSWSQAVEPQYTLFLKLKDVWSSSLYSAIAYSRRSHLFPCGIDIVFLFGWDFFLQGLNKQTHSNDEHYCFPREILSQHYIFFSGENLRVLLIFVSSSYLRLQVFYQFFASMHLPLKLSKDKRLAAT